VLSNLSLTQEWYLQPEVRALARLMMDLGGSSSSNGHLIGQDTKGAKIPEIFHYLFSLSSVQVHKRASKESIKPHSIVLP
jgi:hypothetical protein